MVSLAGSCRAEPMRLLRLVSVVAAVLIASAARGQSATSTALTITSGGSPVTTVKEGTEVILTATVALSGGAAAVPPGQVNFCDVAAAPLKCTDIRLLGTEQLSSTGTAVYRFFPGPGPHSYQATFLGTHVEAASTSSAATLVASPYYPTTTSISASGGAGNYTLTATVTSTGGTVSPTGTISFRDTSNANYVLGTAPLTSDPASFRLSFGFLSPLNIGIEFGLSLAVADFNGDGILDLAEATSGDDQAVVLLGNGDGTFTFTPTFPNLGSGQGQSIVTGDFNGDGIPDIAVVVTGTYPKLPGLVQVLLGNGDGTFRVWQTLSFPAPYALAVGDFNGDGVPDLAMTSTGANSTNGPNDVSILLGNGDGSFTLKSTVTGFITPTSIIAGDFNGDGKMDLAVVDEATSSSVQNGFVTILLGNGDGTFTTLPETPATGQGPVFITTGDLNGDGILDLAVANALSNSVTVLLGNGDGTFTPTAASPTAGGGPQSVAVGDFNGDGKADLVTANGSITTVLGDSTVSVFLGNGDGTFAAAANEPAGVGAFVAAAGDFNASGLDDIAVADDGKTNLISVIVSQVGAQSATATVSGISPVGQGTHLVDANYPGDTDYKPSVSGTITLTAEQEPTTLKLTANPTSSGYGQQVTLTATLAPLTAQNHSATGSIAFTVGSTMLGSVPIGTGVIVFQTKALPVGTDTVTATYEGDTNFAYATASVTATVSPYASATTLTAAPNPAGVGQTVTLTAAVTGTGSPAPTGTVTFYDGATQLSQATLDGTGHATYSTATLALGTHSLTAVYAGNAIYAPSTSPIVSEPIENAGFTMTLSNPSTSVSFYLDTDSILGGASGPLGSRREPPSSIVLAWLFSPLGFFAALGHRRKRRLPVLLMGLLLACLPIAVIGCGSSVITPLPSAAPGIYTIPITATGTTTGLTHTAQLTLTATP